MGLATMVSVSLIVVMVTEAFFVTGSDLHSGKVLELEFGVGKGRGRSNPTYLFLVTHHLATDPSCCRCGAHFEYIFHLLSVFGWVLTIFPLVIKHVTP